MCQYCSKSSEEYKDKRSFYTHVKTHMWKCGVFCQRLEGALQKNHTTEEIMENATTRESLTKKFSVLFPREIMTRKMQVIGIVAPKQIRKFKMVYKMLKIEQMGESLHNRWNSLNQRFSNTSNKSKRDQIKFLKMFWFWFFFLYFWHLWAMIGILSSTCFSSIH